MIGAIARLGLASTANDGRFSMIGEIRELTGAQTVQKLIQAGIDGIYTLDGKPVTEGTIFNDPNKSVKPCPVMERLYFMWRIKMGSWER